MSPTTTISPLTLDELSLLHATCNGCVYRPVEPQFHCPRADEPEPFFPQTAVYSRVEPRQGDLPADCVIGLPTLLLWAVGCLAFWGPVAIVVVLFMAGG